jgi:RimJ/RimL family protein N-acetyltransferase
MPPEPGLTSNPNGDGHAATCGPLVRAGHLVDLRRHLPAHRETFVRWYQDTEIAEMLRHDLTPLNPVRARGYFDSIILPASSRGTCWAIHLHATGRLIGSTAVTDVDERAGTSMFRLVIGEKDTWGNGYGTEATRLVLVEAFESLGLRRVNLEVFSHNPRAYRAYEKSGFFRTGQHQEWVAPMRRWIDIVEMSIDRDRWRLAG